MDPKDLFNEYLNRQKFEHELINRRVTWLLTSQALLFAAYGLGANKDNVLAPLFLKVIAGCGLLSSLCLLLGIAAGAMAKRRSWLDYLCLVDLNDIKQNGSTFEKKLGELRREWGVRKRITELALVPDLLLPVLFLVAWAIVLVCSPIQVSAP